MLTPNYEQYVLETYQDVVSRNSPLESLAFKKMMTSDKKYQCAKSNKSQLIEQLADQMQNYFEESELAPRVRFSSSDEMSDDSISYEDAEDSDDDDINDEGSAVS